MIKAMINISPEDLSPLLSPSLTLEEIANAVSNKNFTKVSDIDVPQIVSEKTSEITVDVSIEDDPDGVAVAEGILNDRSLKACNKGIVEDLSEALSGGQILFDVTKESFKSEARQKLSLLDSKGPFLKIREEFNGVVYDWLSVADQLDMVSDFLDDVCRSRSKDFLSWAFSGKLIQGVLPNSMDDLSKMWCRRDLASSVLGPLVGWISTPDIMQDPKVQAVWLFRKLEKDLWCDEVEKRGFVFDIDNVNWETFLGTNQWLSSGPNWKPKPINRFAASEDFVSSPRFLLLLEFLPQEKLHQILSGDNNEIAKILPVASEDTRKKALSVLQEYVLENGTARVSTGVTRSLNRL